MTHPTYPHPDAARSRLRASVAAITLELDRLPAPAPSDTDRQPLLRAWETLVKQLALGPDPDVRECPVCQHLGMRAATRCGNCWTRLVPPEPILRA